MFNDYTRHYMLWSKHDKIRILWGMYFYMTDIQIKQLKNDLETYAAENAPCKNGSCPGILQCDFGIDSKQGEICMIDEIVGILLSKYN